MAILKYYFPPPTLKPNQKAYFHQGKLSESVLGHLPQGIDDNTNVGQSKGQVKVGGHAPDFSLLNQNGQPVRLSELIGKKIIVLYFYNRDFGSTCTTETCAFRDNYEVFKKANADVIGVSSQSIDSNKKFALANSIPFILLSDEAGKVRKLYGVSTSFGLMAGRATYVIDKKGIVRHVFSSQFNPMKHIEETLRIVGEIGEG